MVVLKFIEVLDSKEIVQVGKSKLFGFQQIVAYSNARLLNIDLRQMGNAAPN